MVSCTLEALVTTHLLKVPAQKQKARQGEALPGAVTKGGEVFPQFIFGDALVKALDVNAVA